MRDNAMDPDLLTRYIEGRCDAEERRACEDWLREPAHLDALGAMLARRWAESSGGSGTPVAAADRARLWAALRDRIDAAAADESATPSPIPAHRRGRLRAGLRVTAAAAVAGLGLFVSRSVWEGRERRSAPVDRVTAAEPRDVTAPDRARPMLTLADGRRIYLDGAAEGTRIHGASLDVRRDGSGAIVFQAVDAGPVEMRTLSIPRGSRPVRMVLADGTAVWLNAASSITYPSGFRGAERVVSMTGEAYFEVAHDAGHPFLIEQGDLRVRVFGTRFNLRAYDDRGRRQITLLEGSVQVRLGSRSGMLEPGQQAEVDPGRLTVRPADTESVMAWKNGQFLFDGVDLPTILQEVARHYDVEVTFRDEIPYRFVARISRDMPVSALLEKLSLTGLVRFDVQGGEIMVYRP